MTLIDAPITYNIENSSKESELNNTCYRHLTYEIRNINKGTKQSIFTDAYSFVSLLKSIGQYEKIDLLCKLKERIES